MPPPIINISAGMSFNCKAPVESMILGSSGKNGKRTGLEPTAIIACSNFKDMLVLSGLVIVNSVLEENSARPCIISTLRCFAKELKPPVKRLMVCFSTQPRKFLISTSGLEKFMPISALSLASFKTLAACNSALDGIQPTFKHTPPIFP